MSSREGLSSLLFPLPPIRLPPCQNFLRGLNRKKRGGGGGGGPSSLAPFLMCDRSHCSLPLVSPFFFFFAKNGWIGREGRGGEQILHDSAGRRGKFDISLLKGLPAQYTASANDSVPPPPPPPRRNSFLPPL